MQPVSGQFTPNGLKFWKDLSITSIAEDAILCLVVGYFFVAGFTEVVTESLSHVAPLE